MIRMSEMESLILMWISSYFILGYILATVIRFIPKLKSAIYSHNKIDAYEVLQTILFYPIIFVAGIYCLLYRIVVGRWPNEY